MIDYQRIVGGSMKKNDKNVPEVKNESRPIEDYALDPSQFVSASTSVELKEELGVDGAKVEVNTQPAEPVKKKVTISPRFQQVLVKDDKTGEVHSETTTVSHNAIDRKTGQVIESKQIESAVPIEGTTPMVAVKKKKVRSRWFSFTLACIFLVLCVGFTIATYYSMPTFMQTFSEFSKPGWLAFFVLPMMIILILLAVTVVPMFTFGILAAVFFGHSMKSPVKGIRIPSIIMFVLALLIVISAPIVVIVTTLI